MLQMKLRPEQQELAMRVQSLKREARQKRRENWKAAVQKSVEARKTQPPKSRTRPKRRAKESKPRRPLYPKVSFSETLIGKFLAIHAPVELKMLQDTLARDPSFRSSSKRAAKEIDSLAKSSSNPAFRMAEFRVALAEYRKTGLRPKKKAGWTLDEAIAATRARLVSAVK